MGSETSSENPLNTPDAATASSSSSLFEAAEVAQLQETYARHTNDLRTMAHLFGCRCPSPVSVSAPASAPEPTIMRPVDAALREYGVSLACQSEGHSLSLDEFVGIVGKLTRGNTSAVVTICWEAVTAANANANANASTNANANATATAIDKGPSDLMLFFLVLLKLVSAASAASAAAASSLTTVGTAGSTDSGGRACVSCVSFVSWE